MKQRNTNLLLGMLTLCAFCFSMSSCGGNEDDEETVSENKYAVSRVDTYTLTPPFVYGSYLVNHQTSSVWVENKWKPSGPRFHVYVSQDNAFTDLGLLNSKETSIATADLKKAVHVDVPIPASIDVSRPYQVVATCGVITKLVGDKITSEAELLRDTVISCPSWHSFQGGVSAEKQSGYLAVYECLYVENLTAKPIRVRHMGYDTADKWYATKGEISISPDLVMETMAISTSGEAMSTENTIGAGKKDWFSSLYVPTGKKMTNARLILEIDGKEVKTPVVSSDVTIENGIPTFLSVKWDGTTLEWN